MSSPKDFLKGNAGTLALFVMLALSLGLNVYLLRVGRPPWAPSPMQVVKVNTQLPATLPLVTADGQATTLSFAADSRPTVLYVLSPVCEWCKRNEPNIKALVSAADNRYRFVGLSILSQGLKQYIAKGNAPFPVYFVKSQAVSRKLGLVGTPETIVVSPTGKVEQVWEGAYMKPNLQKVEDYFGVPNLPGLKQLAAVAN